MDTTRVSGPNDNSTYLDNVEIPYENVTYLDYSENLAPDTVLGINSSNATFFSLPVWLMILIISISTWILVTNGLVFFCLVTNRNALKNNVNVQLLSLCVTDVLVGIITIPCALMPVMLVNSKYETCAFLIYMFFLAQCATLCHTLLICVNRLLTIKRKSNVKETNNATLKTICMQILAIWVGCLLYFGIHFFAFARFGETVKRCSTLYLFKDNDPVGLGFLTGVPLIPSQLCTNIIYVYLFIYIRKRLRSVGIVQVKPNRPKDDIRLNSQTKTLGDEQTSHRLMIPSVSEGTKGPDSSIGYTQTNVRPINEAGTSSTCKSERYGDNILNRDIHETAVNTRERGGDVTESSRLNNNRVGLEKQRRVLVTFGILLISLNLFMTPLGFLVIIEMFNNGPLPRGIRFAFCTMAMLNSALNPVINVWRIKPFRLIMRDKVTKICEFFSFRQT